MRGNFFTVLGLLIILLCSGFTAQTRAQQEIELPNPLNAESLEEIVSNIVDFLFYLSIILAPLMIIIAGFLFVTAGGNADQIGKAKKIILWACVGFLIILLSKGIIVMIEQVVG